MTSKKARSMAGLPWIAAMAFFMQALDATILNTALPAIAHSLNRSPLAMQSAIISYTLTVAMLIPVSGWLADRFGTRRVFMVAVSLFTLGSLACALSSSLSELVIFRVVQGVGGAMMMPVARLALLRAYPRSELLPVLNFVTMPGLVGPILGPVLGGVLVTWASWHWIFLINIPIGVAGILYARKYMPNFTTPRSSSIITSVAINACTRPFATITPVTAPIAAPSASAAATATSAFTSTPTIEAATAPVRASREPTDRSIPDVRITNVIPTAIMALTEVC